MSFAAETVAYTLTTAKTGTGGNNSAYASAVDYTANGITWNVTGNSEMVPWRIGGKSITNVDRAVYTKTALAADVTKIEITHGTVNCTLNSCTLIVSDAANGAGETYAVTVAQNTTSTITLPEGDYSNKYYKLVYNVTVSGSSNKYVQLSEIKFYTEVQTSIEAPTFTPEEGKVAANNTFAEPFALTIASATEGATIKYTLDGTDPALETALTYEAPVAISTMVKVRAIAVKGEESSVEATATYIVASTEEKPYTASEAITAQSLGLAASVYVTGTVKSIEEISTQYGNATYNITDGVKELKIYRGKNLGNVNFTSADQLLVGDVVVVKGDLTSYNGAAQLGQNNYLISRIPAVVNHTITVSANPAEGGVVTGGGEFEETDEITVKAVANDGYEFVNWTENEEEVSTDAEYTFTVEADRNLVANFKVAEPVIEWIEMELEIANLTTVVMEVGGKKYLQLNGRNDMEDADVTLFLNDYADADGDYVVNTETAYLTYGGMELTVIEGVMTQTSETDKGTIYTGTVRASVTDEEEGGTMYVEFALTMYSAPATVLVLTDAIVAINEELGTLTFNVATEEGGYYAELAGYTGPGVHEGPQICLFETPEVIAYATYVETEVVDGVITLTGEFTSPNGPKFDLTISGKLPVVEPTTITYELNGGELPTATVPTQDSLIAAFKDGYNAYFGVSVATTRVIDNFLYAGAAVNNPTCDVSLFMKDDASPWKWLGDYVLAVTNAQIEAGLLVNLKELATELMWRQSLTGFFLQQAKLDSNYKGNADFTEAGKPEAWGAAYQAAHAVVLPTEPVTEDYVLPTPVKEGCKFVGWYDNAEGTGEAYTVIPAGWAGTLYAIWKVEGPATALENIAVEGKAVKAIINGQLVIIKNGVQYNAQGAILK